MTPRCRQAVQAAAAAAGRRPLTANQLDSIDSRIRASMKQLARTDPTWQAKSADQRLGEGAQAAVAELQAEAMRKIANAQLQLLKTAATEERIGVQTTLFQGSRAEGTVRDMQNTDVYIKGVKNEAIANLKGLMDAAKDPTGATGRERVAMFVFDAENPAMTRDLALEVFDNANGSTGNALAKKGARAWLDTIEPMRQRFNAAGGDIGRLDYGYVPQSWDTGKVLKGYDAFAEFLLPRVDRRRYLDVDGTPMNDAAVLDLLRFAADTISTEGQNKTVPGQFKGTGARANAGSEHRQIHFKDGESYLEAMAQFGRGSMYEAMIGHVNKLSRDIGLVERYGPNPEQMMRLQMDVASRADGGEKYVFANKVDGYWSVLSGAAGVPQNAMLSRVGETLRALQTAGKLGGAVLSSITDIGTFAVSTGYNRLPYFTALANVGRVMTKDTRDFMSMHGIIAESMIGDLNRFSGDHLTTGLAARLAQSTLKLSGLNAWTDTLRNAFQLTMMQGMARMSRTDWGALAGFDRDRMVAHGITEADWGVIRAARLTQRNGLDFLTPEAIYASGHADAQQVVSKVLGLIRDEGEVAVINPDLATRTVQTWGGQQAGTGLGELARATMQFKSFPIAMISRHWRRMTDTGNLDPEGRPTAANPLVYGVSLGVSLMGLGAIAFQAKQVAAGKDPVDMTGDHAAKFWTQAFVQGGGASILGDMILADTTQSGTGFATATAKNLIGPALGTVLEAGAIVKDNVDKRLKGQPTHAGADALKTARSNLPFVNIWYAKAAVDHLGFHALQETLSPGYLSRMQGRARKDWGQRYYWTPGSSPPDRPPNLAGAVGVPR